VKILETSRSLEASGLILDEEQFYPRNEVKAQVLV